LTPLISFFVSARRVEHKLFLRSEQDEPYAEHRPGRWIDFEPGGALHLRPHSDNRHFARTPTSEHLARGPFDEIVIKIARINFPGRTVKIAIHVCGDLQWDIGLTEIESLYNQSNRKGPTHENS
jgi:hypothetical protein